MSEKRATYAPNFASGLQRPEIDATDAARTLATTEGIELAEVTGTGKDGRITKADVEAVAEQEE